MLFGPHFGYLHDLILREFEWHPEMWHDADGDLLVIKCCEGLLVKHLHIAYTCIYGETVNRHELGQRMDPDCVVVRG
jgi:hypothetical protein